MAQTLVRELSRDFNADLLNREIKAAFPAKFIQGDATYPGFEVDEAQFTTGSSVIGRIVTPVAATVTVTTIDGVATDTAEPGELRMFFDPDLTVPQVTNLDDNILVDHVVTGTTPIQAAEDLDDETLTDMQAFADLGDFLSQSTAAQNQQMQDINRMIQRAWDRLQAAV